MRHPPFLLRVRPAALALAMMAPWAATAQTAAAPSAAAVPVMAAAPCGRVDIAPVVQIPVGKSTVIKPATAVTRILLGNPERARAARPAEKDDGKVRRNEEDSDVNDRLRPGVADVDVLLLSPNEIYLLGKTIGSTNVVMLDRSGACTAFDVVVGMDTTALQTVLQQLLPDEKDIKVTSAFDSIVLTGTVTDSGALGRVTDLATAYVRGTGGGGSASVQRNPRIVNMLAVGAPQQVMLEVKVAEVSKTLLDKLGAQGILAPQTNGGYTYSLLANFLTGSAGVLTGGRRTGSFQATLDAEKRDGMVKILAEPNVMAISGQEGSFLAGGKVFIPVAQDNQSGRTTITLEEKEFGVALKFTPTVLDGGRINLKVAPEVSELNREGIGISLSGSTQQAILPSFTTRRAATTVQLMDGQSFAIGGLIKNNSVANIRAFPILGELPIIGALFRSSDFQADRSELVFVVTPRLVKPLPPNYALPTDHYIEPNRVDLFLNGRLEGRPPASPEAAATDGPASAPAPAGSGGFITR